MLNRVDADEIMRALGGLSPDNTVSPQTRESLAASRRRLGISEEALRTSRERIDRGNGLFEVSTDELMAALEPTSHRPTLAAQLAAMEDVGAAPTSGVEPAPTSDSLNDQPAD